MSASLKSPDWLKDAECKKGQLSHPPPIPYIPVVDAITPKEESQIFKIKLPNVSHLSMPIYSRGNNKEYLAHISAVLQVIKQKGLPKKCQVLAKAVVRRSEALKNLQEAAESRDTVLTTVDVMARKVEIEQTQQMLQEAQKAHDKAIAESYEQLRNLLSGDIQSQWDCICRKMHKRGLWAAVNGQVTKGRHQRTWTSFLDCLELHKLTVFSADAAKRQWFYIQQAVRKPQRATVRQHISLMGVLNDYVKHLPTLKDSSKAVLTTKKGIIPFGEADLAAIVLSSVPMLWQNQYNLNRSTVPKSTRTLLPDLEAIERVMVEKKMRTLRRKERAVQPHPRPKVTRSPRRLRAQLVKSLRRVAVRSFANVARPMAVASQPTTPWTAIAMTTMVIPSRQQQVSPLSPRSPTRSLGAIRA
jgi:hypothetical protein